MEREFFGHATTCPLVPLHFSDNPSRRGRKCGANRNCNYPTLTTPESGGIFNPPPVPGGAAATSLTSSGLETRGWLAPPRRYTYVYTLSIAWGRAAAQVIDRSPPSSRDHLLSRAIFSPYVCLRGRASPARWSIAVWPWDRSSATRNIDNFSCTQC